MPARVGSNLSSTQSGRVNSAYWGKLGSHIPSRSRHCTLDSTLHIHTNTHKNKIKIKISTEQCTTQHTAHNAHTVYIEYNAEHFIQCYTVDCSLDAVHCSIVHYPFTMHCHCTVHIPSCSLCVAMQYFLGE